MTVDVDRLRRWITDLDIALQQNQDLLDDLDAGAGDGDHGATMVMAFRRVRGVVDDPYPDPAALLKAAGRAFAGVGGSIGPLWGMAALRAAQAAGSQPTLTLPALTTMLTDAVAGAAQIGRAHRGDRTLLDAAAPAAEAFAAALARDGSRAASQNADDATTTDGVAGQAARRGLAAALEGAASTRTMGAARGRASRNPTLAAGRVDAGCASVALAWTVAVAPSEQDRWRECVASADPT